MMISYLFFLSVCLVTCTSSPSYLVDISALLQNSDPKAQHQVKLQIDQALRENGFIVITGHGLSSTLSEDSFKSAKTLFELDLSDKKEVAIRNDNTSFGRGYLGFGDESGLSSTFEPKEGYSYGNPSHALDSLKNSDSTSAVPNTPHIPNLLSLPNKWPKTLSNSDVHILNTLYDEKVRVAHVIVNALSEMFSCSGSIPDKTENLTHETESTHETDHTNTHTTSTTSTSNTTVTLSDMITGGREISLMRMFHYYHQQSATVQQHLQSLHHTSSSSGSSTAPTMLGSSPHTDWGFLTLILADEVGGLQFIPREARISEENWVDIPYIPGSVIINGGDYLKLISRGVYHSPIHRVLSPGSRGSTCSGGSSSSSGSSGGGSGDSSMGSSSSGTSGVGGSSDSTSVDGSNTFHTTTTNTNAATVCADRYSFVFFFYPSYTSPVSDSVLSHCTHYLHNSTSGSSSRSSYSGGGNSIEGGNSGGSSGSNSEGGMGGSSSSSSSSSEGTVDSNGDTTQVFNTLLNLEEGSVSTSADSSADGSSSSSSSTTTRVHQFGDYVIQKWKGVYRRDDVY